MPGASATSSGTAPSTAVSVAWPDAEHDRVGALDLDAAVDVVHARREEQVLAAGELVVDRPAPSRDGFAMKKSVIGMRAARRLAFVPRDAAACRSCAEGTRTS